MKRLIAAVLLCALTPCAQAQLMDAKQEATIKAALPHLANLTADDALHGQVPGSKRLFYTSLEIPHAPQMFNPGVAIFSTQRNVAANPDGFPSTDFDFPWKNAGGTDYSHIYPVKVMYLPPGGVVRVHRGDLNGFFSNESGKNGYDWTFPVGTMFFEIQFFGDRLVAFEVRSRTKVAEGRWRMNIYRPFVHRDEYLAAAKLPDSAPQVTKYNFGDGDRSLTMHRTKQSVWNYGYVDDAPALESKDAVNTLIRSQVFKSAMGKVWCSQNGNDCNAPTASGETSVVPKHYMGALIGNTNEHCMSCHQDAGQHVRHFDNRREWYNFIRGSVSEKILSFRPINTGNPATLNRAMVDAGMIVWDERRR